MGGHWEDSNNPGLYMEKESCNKMKFWAEPLSESSLTQIIKNNYIYNANFNVNLVMPLSVYINNMS